MFVPEPVPSLSFSIVLKAVKYRKESKKKRDGKGTGEKANARRVGTKKSSVGLAQQRETVC